MLGDETTVPYREHEILVAHYRIGTWRAAVELGCGLPAIFDGETQQDAVRRAKESVDQKIAGAGFGAVTWVTAVKNPSPEP